MLGTKYRVVRSAKNEMFYIQQSSWLTAFIWVFVGFHPEARDSYDRAGYTTIELAEAAIEQLTRPKFEVVNKEQ
jgi:hypothetical protein